MLKENVLVYFLLLNINFLNNELIFIEWPIKIFFKYLFQMQKDESGGTLTVDSICIPNEIESSNENNSFQYQLQLLDDDETNQYCEILMDDVLSLYNVSSFYYYYHYY